MKSSWGWALWEAMEGHWWRCSLSCSWWLRTESVMQRSWDLAPWREPERAYWWSLVAAEDPQHIGDASTMGWSPRTAVAVGWINLSLECYRGQSWRSDSAFRGAQKIMCDPQILKREIVTLRLPWRPQDVQDARTQVYLMRKAAKRKSNQPGRKKFIAVIKDEKKELEIWRPLWYQT